MLLETVAAGKGTEARDVECMSMLVDSGRNDGGNDESQKERRYVLRKEM